MYSTTCRLIGTLLVFFANIVTANAQELSQPIDFKGKYIISVSDADMVASAYVNGKLGKREGSDALSVIRLDGDYRNWKAVEIEASNSVAGPPAALDISPDGRFAVVVETFTQRPENNKAHTFRDLKPGTMLRVFDLSSPDNPKLVQEVKTLTRPEAVSFNARGDLVAITYHPKGDGTKTPIALYRFKNGRLGERAVPKLKGWTAGERMIGIDWHPSENTLAILDASGGATVRFARVNPNLTLTPYGNVVDIEREPFRVKFTPDGRHVVINAVYWGADIAGRWIEAPRGSVLTVRVNAQTKADGTTRHAFVSSVKTGVSPEGLAISPNGKWVATTNLERSYLPYNDKRITWFSSISLISLDPKTGVLSKVNDFNYDGILPEAAVFDNSSQFLAVANYDHFNQSKKGGSIDFWRIQADPLEPNNTQLIKMDHSVPVARGPHSMVIAR